MSYALDGGIKLSLHHGEPLVEQEAVVARMIAVRHKPFVVTSSDEQQLFRFGNGYGASVIPHKASYAPNLNLVELAVIRFTGEQDRWEFCSDTPVTEGAYVIGHLSADQANNILDEIAALQPVNPQPPRRHFIVFGRNGFPLHGFYTRQEAEVFLANNEEASEIMEVCA